MDETAAAAYLFDVCHKNILISGTTKINSEFLVRRNCNGNGHWSKKNNKLIKPCNNVF